MARQGKGQTFLPTCNSEEAVYYYDCAQHQLFYSQQVEVLYLPPQDGQGHNYNVMHIRKVTT